MVDAEWLDWRYDRVELVAAHGIDVFEFEEAFFEARRKIHRVGPADRNPNETIYHVLRRTASGRYLFMVILLYANRPVALPLTAREMTAREKRWYRK